MLEKNTNARNGLEVGAKGLAGVAVVGAFFWGLIQGIASMPEVHAFVLKYVAENGQELWNNLAVYGVPFSVGVGVVNWILDKWVFKKD